jgi:hypothetical protein
MVSDHSAAGPDSPLAKNPSSEKSAQDDKDNVDQDLVATAFHNQTGEPSCY